MSKVVRLVVSDEHCSDVSIAQPSCALLTSCGVAHQGVALLCLPKITTLNRVASRGANADQCCWCMLPGAMASHTWLRCPTLCGSHVQFSFRLHMAKGGMQVAALSFCVSPWAMCNGGEKWRCVSRNTSHGDHMCDRLRAPQDAAHPVHQCWRLLLSPLRNLHGATHEGNPGNMRPHLLAPPRLCQRFCVLYSG